MGTCDRPGSRDPAGRNAGLIDITQGNNTFGPFSNGDGKTYTVQGYTAGPGYDLASGLGTFNGAALVRALAERARGE